MPPWSSGRINSRGCRDKSNGAHPCTPNKKMKNGLAEIMISLYNAYPTLFFWTSYSVNHSMVKVMNLGIMPIIPKAIRSRCKTNYHKLSDPTESGEEHENTRTSTYDVDRSIENQTRQPRRNQKEG